MARLAQTAGLTDIQQEILSTVRTFVDKEIIPHASALEHEDAYPQDIVDGMKEMGLFGLTIPEQYGGLGESLLTYALVVEQIARGWMSVSGVINTHFIVAHMINHHGTDEQKQRHLPAMALGETRGSFSMSEPDLGSDVAAIKTRAVADGDEFVIDGAKMWLTNGGTSNLTAVLVRTDEGAPRPHQNLTCFLVEKPVGYGEVAPGLIIPGKIDKMGYKGVDTTEMVFRGFRVPGRGDPGRQARRRLRPDDGRRRGRPGQRGRPGLRYLDPGLRAGRRVRPAALDVRQADRRAPGHRVQAGRDGDQGRGRAPDDGQRGPAEGLRPARSTSRRAWPSCWPASTASR